MTLETALVTVTKTMLSAMPTAPAIGESGTSRRRDYLFIDNVRFVSLIAIVMRHCEISLFRDYHVSALENAITQIRSFGVLLFFINSGFLMAAWLARPNTSVEAYWRGRLTRIGQPWLIWAGAHQVIVLVKFFFREGGQWRYEPGHRWRSGDGKPARI